MHRAQHARSSSTAPGVPLPSLGRRHVACSHLFARAQADTPLPLARQLRVVRHAVRARTASACSRSACSAQNVLVLIPGTLASAGIVLPARAPCRARRVGGAWAVERRENQLEDQSVSTASSFGTTSASEAFDYYLGWPCRTLDHEDLFELIPTADVTYAREWGHEGRGSRTLRRVVDDARGRTRRPRRHSFQALDHDGV